MMMLMMTMTIIATCILSISTVGLYNVNHIVNFIVYVSDLKQLYWNTCNHSFYIILFDLLEGAGGGEGEAVKLSGLHGFDPNFFILT